MTPKPQKPDDASKRTALTIRLPRDEWERLHRLALDEGVSIQTLAVQSFNLMFKLKGQRAMRVETFNRVRGVKA